MTKRNVDLSKLTKLLYLVTGTPSILTCQDARMNSQIQFHQVKVALALAKNLGCLNIEIMFGDLPYA